MWAAFHEDGFADACGGLGGAPPRPPRRVPVTKPLAATILLASLCGAPPAAPVDDTAAAPQRDIVLRDDAGREVRFAHPAERVVTLLPSLTETVCALGACARLVATDRYSDWPAEVRSLPKTGGLDDAEVEEIVRLRPDVVLLSHSQRITGRLQELGVRTVALDTQTFAHIAHTVALIGQVLGLPERAAALNLEIDRRVRAVSESARAHRQGAGPSVYVEVDRAPYAAGADSFLGEMLARLGARNIVTPDLGPFPRLNPEYVVRHDPDVIIVTEEELPDFTERPGWDQIRAVKERRVCSFPLEIRYMIERPGPRVADAMQALEACLERVAP
jgi:iron complex transport system substrate-binding protein